MAATRSTDGALHDDITIPQGSAWNRTWPVVDSTGAPLTVTGWSVRGQVRASPADAVLFEWNTTPAAGKGPASVSGATVTVALLGTESAAWTWRRAVYDVYLTSPAGEPTRIVEGSIIISPSVTH